MIIYFDATPLFRNKRDGIATYTIGILESLIKLDDTNKYVGIAFSSDRKMRPLVEKSDKLTYAFLPFPRKFYNIVFKLFRIPVNHFLTSKPDLVWFPNFISYPYIKDTPSIVTVHDLAFVRHPDLVSKRNARYLRKYVPWSIRKATAITTISNFIRDEIKEEYSISDREIHTISPGISTLFTNTKPAKLDKKYGLVNNYFLYIGTIEPRKNIGTLLDAYQLLPAKIREEYDLVLIGSGGWNNELIQRINSLEGKGVRWLGFVNDPDMLSILNRATVFVLPSHYEGFGIPILEAMSQGVPVITSNTGPTVEIAKNYGLTVDIHSPKKIASSIEELVDNPSLRHKLSSLGIQRVKDFTWDESGTKLKELFDYYGRKIEK